MDIMAELLAEILLPFCLLFSSSDARCRPDQVEACRAAVRSDSLSTFDNGGACEPRDYDIYDHLCALNYYTSGVDYCCCAHERDALCCRFYYDHKYFRCDQEQDFINVPLSTTVILIITGVVFVFVAVVIIAVVIKFVKGKKSNDPYSSYRCCTETKQPSGGHEMTEASQPEAENLMDESAFVHISRANSDMSPGTGGAIGRARVTPTAPSVNQVVTPPSYHRAMSEPAQLSGPRPAAFHGKQHDMYRRYSESAHMEPVPEAPPSYDEHHDHPLIHPEMNGSTDEAAGTGVSVY